MLLLPVRVIIPAGKYVVFFSDRLSRGNIATSVADVSFVFIGNCIHCLAITDVNYIIAIAGVIEFSVVIFSTISSAFFVCKTSQIIFIFIRYGITSSGACVTMIQLIGRTMICSAAFSRENLHIIICGFTAISSLWAIEGSTI